MELERDTTMLGNTSVPVSESEHLHDIEADILAVPLLFMWFIESPAHESQEICIGIFMEALSIKGKT